MGFVQEIQGNQATKTLNNNTYGSTDSNRSSSYVSSSGVKSILSNAWNAIKSAFSNVLSAFGNHLGGQQGSTKPGREITMEPTQPLPGNVGQINNSVYGSSDDNPYASVYGNIGPGDQENIYTTIDNRTDIHQPSAPKGPTSARPGLPESPYSEIIMDMFSRPLPPIPAGSSELKDESTGESVYATVKKSTVAQKDTNYREAWGVENSTMAGNVEHGETVDMPSPAQGYNTNGTPLYTQVPENDPRGENDYADPKELLFNQEQFLQRMMSERLKTL